MSVPSAEQRKVLQRSGNRCAFPPCRIELTVPATDDDPLATMGEIAHIVGEKPTAPRGKSPLSLQERNKYANLILLCNNHHEIVDSQENTWTVEKLLSMRVAHEEWVRTSLAVVGSPTDGTAGAPLADRADPERGAQPGPGCTFPLVSSAINREALGIHPAIPLLGGTDDGLSAELPVYVPRDHDQVLHSLLQERTVGGGFILLIGPAAAGKTRSAYEAARTVLPDWNFVLPEPGFWQDLSQLRSAPPRSLVWVDEIATAIDSGELTASAVRSLLADPNRSVILLGSIWPADYERLTATTGDGPPGPGRSGRETLQMARHISVSPAFSAAERERADGLAKTDPRLGEAVTRHQDGAVPAVLACSPELIQRWTQAGNPFGAAIITAATEAVLCGHPRTVPAAVLRALAEHHLTGAQRAAADQDWFSIALQWACRPVRGSIAPLTPYARSIGHVDGYVVSDILVHHASDRYAANHQAPLGPWETLVDLAHDDVCLSIGLHAFSYSLHEPAERALMRAARVEHPEAFTPLGMTLAEQGKFAEASRWLERSAENGQSDACALLAIVLAQQGDIEGTKKWLRRSIDEQNDAFSMWGLGQIMEAEGDTETAAHWYQRASDTGADGGAGMTFLGLLSVSQGDSKAAAAYFVRAADAGNVEAMLNLGLLLQDRGDSDGALERFRQAAELGVVEGAARLGDLLRQSGDLEGARLWLGRAAGAGHRLAMTALGAVLWQLGATDEARVWLQRSAEAGDAEAMTALEVLFDDPVDRSDAQAWSQPSA